MVFFKDLIFSLLEEGHSVNIVTNENEAEVPSCYKKRGCEIFHISCKRTPLRKETLQAIYQIKKIVEDGEYDIVHCHTPVAALCTRLACRNLRKKGLKVFYTAHGFHFYTGASFRNWLLYYPVEWLCSRFTDTLITINHEDFERAKKHFKTNNIIYVPGVGIDTNRFVNAKINRADYRRKLNVPENAFMLISVGELNKNKNHEVIIRTLAKLSDRDIHYVVAGEGDLLNHLERISRELGVSAQVHFLGYRSDIEKIYKASDVCVFPSFREGLPVALMEAMASGLPCVSSSNRGSMDLIDDKGGLFCKASNIGSFADAILFLRNNPDLCREMGVYNQIKINEFSIEKVMHIMKKIYINK